MWMAMVSHKQWYLHTQEKESHAVNFWVVVLVWFLFF